MLVFISGGVRSGKSALGEQYAQTLGQEGYRIYLATAMVTDAEMAARVQKHRRNRREKGFVTIEQPRNVGLLAEKISHHDTVLLDCLGNLLANEMFGEKEIQNGRAVFRRVARDLDALAAQCEHLILISNDIFSEGTAAGKETEEYRQVLGLLHQHLAKRADTVAECVCGVPLYHKGKPNFSKTGGGGNKMILILGGSHQGKSRYAADLYGGTPLVFDFKRAKTADFERAFQADILQNIHEAVRSLLLAGEDPMEFFQKNQERLADKIITGDEVGSGVVPIDAKDRKWRDETGRLYSLLAEHAQRVERVYVGIPQTIRQQTESFGGLESQTQEKRGLVHLYYGDGKGKTTAALGLGMRASGAGQPVLLVQFLKGLDSSELAVLERIGQSFRLLPGVPVKKFTRTMTPEERRKTMEEQQELFCGAVKECFSGKVQMVVLDELVDAVNFGAVSLAQVRDFLSDPSRRCEVVITGHHPAEEWFDLCDYITEMKKVRHPFDEGIRARMGIEK